MTETILLLSLVLLPFPAAAVCWLCARYGKAGMRGVPAAAAAGLELILALAAALYGGDAALRIPGLCGLGLTFALDGFRRLYAAVAAFLWLVALLLSRQYFARDTARERARFDLFSLLTLGAVMGLFLSDDLGTAFVFFELLSFTSYAWVAHTETDAALRAADTYLAVAVIGGLTALMGLFLLQHALGTLELSALYAAARACPDRGTLYAAGGCLLFGFGAKAGIWPLHIWLPKAHPAAPAPASALLSGALTKCGVFGVLAVSCGIFRADARWGALLLALGVVTMAFGALLALLSVDLKRTLACSSVSQIGFIVVGVGLMCLLGPENGLAARGTVLHMVNHSLFKLTLFLTAGAVYMNAHALDLNDVRGFGRNKPFLHAVFLCGALGIGGVPGFSGYISKTLLHEAIVEYAHISGSRLITAAEWLFLAAGGLTLAYMAKLYAALFLERHPARQAEFDGMRGYVSAPSAAALAAAALPIPVLGLLPHGTMDALADAAMPFLAGGEAARVAYFSFENLKGAGVSLLIGAAVYFLIVRRLLMRDGRYVDRLSGRFDLEDRLYRPVLLRVLPAVLGAIAALFGENRILAPVVRRLLCRGGTEMQALSDAGAQIPEEIPYGDIRERFAYKVGALLDRGYAVRRGVQPAHRLSTALVRLTDQLRSSTQAIVRNLSFSLLMTCVGFTLLLVYLVLIYA